MEHTWPDGKYCPRPSFNLRGKEIREFESTVMITTKKIAQLGQPVSMFYVPMK